MSLSRNHDPRTQDNPQTFYGAVSCKNYFLSEVEFTGTPLFSTGKKVIPVDNKICGFCPVTGS